MKHKMKKATPHIITWSVLAIGLAWVAAVLALTPNADWEDQSTYLMPWPITLLVPVVMNLATMLDNNGKIDLRPRLELWCIFAGALATSYATSFLPQAMLEATILSMMVSVLAYLALVQVTQKTGYQKIILRKTARKLGTREDHPDAKRLSNNDDLAKAIVAGALVTVQVWLLTSSDAFVEWLPLIFNTPQTFSTGAARTAAFAAGGAIGMLYYTYSPNQTEVRKMAKARTNSPKEQNPMSTPRDALLLAAESCEAASAAIRASEQAQKTADENIEAASAATENVIKIRSDSTLVGEAEFLSNNEDRKAETEAQKYEAIAARCRKGAAMIKNN